MLAIASWFPAPALLACSALLWAGAATQDPVPPREGPVPGNPGGRSDQAWRDFEVRKDEIATRESDPRQLAMKASEAEARTALVTALTKAGVRFDFPADEFRIEGRFGSPRMPLEFLLVNDRGAEHESLFVTSVRPSAITTAVHLLGLKPGTNVSWTECDPFPTEDEVRAGARTHDLHPPKGDGVYIYVTWEEGGRKRSYRVEDLVITEQDGRVMPYTPWIFLGSRFTSQKPGEPEYFAADVEGDIASICYFSMGSQVFTNPHPLALRPIFWPNHTLVPDRGTPVEIIFAKQEREAR